MGPWRRAELAEAKRRSRAAQRQAEAEGRPKAHAEALREALADAALIIIATDGPGHEAIMRLVCAGFPTLTGLPLTLRGKARAGRLRPRRLTPDALRRLAADQPS
jgi:dihydroorotase-like cyclic amidohydrolase